MMFAREFAVGLADLIRIGSTFHSEGLIIVVLRHTQGRPGPRPGSFPRPIYFLSSTSTNSASTTLSFGFSAPAPASGPAPSPPGAPPGAPPPGLPACDLYIASASL